MWYSEWIAKKHIEFWMDPVKYCLTMKYGLYFMTFCACTNLFSGMPRELTECLTEIFCDSPSCWPLKKKFVISEEPFFGAPFWRKLFSTIVLKYNSNMSSAETIYDSFSLNLALRIQRIVTYGCSQDVATSGHSTVPGVDKKSIWYTPCCWQMLLAGELYRSECQTF